MKVSQIDRVIQQFEADIKVLELAVEKLKQQQSAAAPRKKRPAKPTDVARTA